MAWFKFGKQDDSVKTQQGPAESVDAMRRRALFRLVGSVVLVLAGVVGFPMLFDSQPRSVPVDITIDIPDKAKVKPLQLPSGTPASSAPAAAAKVDDAASLSGKEEIVTNTPPVAKTPEKKPEVQANTAQTATKSVATGAVVAGAATDKAAADKAAKIKADKEKSDKEKLAKDKAALETSRAKALLDGSPSDVGAFTDAAKSREVRQKVEKAGLKTYSQIAKTADGDLIRVRVGPFTSKAEADKAAAKIKALGLPASILTL
jgi:DedD protein